MPKDYSRTQRVADQLQKELARTIQQEIKDPRLGMVTVSGVDVSRDLAYARVHVTFMGEESKDAIEEQLEVLNKAAGFLRSRLARAVKLRITPQLSFYYDESLSRGRHLSSLIDRAMTEDSQHPKDDTDSAE
ncbi:30S ribosome-binding factor RbfA [Aestuariirhabdus sp. Z084]|uniref:30S ribosome-binding factor RbfA n=1 Tax=Aestuariirhabdus haliotis TaxID=2918751 RepID=UPI00201B3945|nr:30S ribosome-binding factor RbfA [Aestuariirhabdus haliotis]MCL6415428.1 30S ribosome-binding factor RbfA [Aestuariirhabdus haliotis]MCL6419184.1 30S ribosome-binding factor RbfA [Aestuariirhabdus haliotis]